VKIYTKNNSNLGFTFVEILMATVVASVTAAAALTFMTRQSGNLTTMKLDLNKQFQLERAAIVMSRDVRLSGSNPQLTTGNKIDDTTLADTFQSYPYGVNASTITGRWDVVAFYSLRPREDLSDLGYDFGTHSGDAALYRLDALDADAVRNDLVRVNQYIISDEADNEDDDKVQPLVKDIISIQIKAYGASGALIINRTITETGELELPPAFAPTVHTIRSIVFTIRYELPSSSAEKVMEFQSTKSVRL